MPVYKEPIAEFYYEDRYQNKNPFKENAANPVKSVFDRILTWVDYE